jgi:hypothetical protein
MGGGFSMRRRYARLTSFEGENVWDTSKLNGPPCRKLDTSRARERFGFEAKTRFEEGCGRRSAGMGKRGELDFGRTERRLRWKIIR